jgi:hypothetical protein
MKMFARIILTWSLGLALVLGIIDAAKSYAESQLVITSIGDLWQSLNMSSYTASHEWLLSQLTQIGAPELTDQIFALPGWAVFLLLGVLLMIFGRQSRKPIFINTH